MVAAARGRRKTGYHRAIGREPRLGKSKRETARGGCTRAPFPNPISATLPTPPAPYGELQPELLSHPQPQCGWWWPARRPRVNNPDPSCVRVVDETRAGAAAPSSPRKRKVPNYGRDAREGGPGSLFARAIQQCRSKAAALLAWPGHGRERRREPFREAARVVRAGGEGKLADNSSTCVGYCHAPGPSDSFFPPYFLFLSHQGNSWPFFSALILAQHVVVVVPNPKSQIPAKPHPLGRGAVSTGWITGRGARGRLRLRHHRQSRSVPISVEATRMPSSHVHHCPPLSFSPGQAMSVRWEGHCTASALISCCSMLCATNARRGAMGALHPIFSILRPHREMPRVGSHLSWLCWSTLPSANTSMAPFRPGLAVRLVPDRWFRAS